MDPYEVLKEKGSTFDNIVLPEDKLHVIIKLIETQLRTKYTAISLPHIQWLESQQLDLSTIRVPMTVYVRNRFSIDEHVTATTEVGEIFREVQSKIPRRIFVEGHSGYGKTTITLKLASDWAKRQEYLTTHFRAVFLISLRNVNCDLERLITKDCELEGFTNDDLLQTIAYFQESILLILDGLEEMSTTARRDLMYLLKRERFPHMCVLVTCTPGLFQIDLGPVLSESPRRSRFTSVRVETGEKTPFWTKRIELPGIRKNYQHEFLNQHFGPMSDQIGDFLTRRLPVNLDYLCQCPLFLLLLAQLIVKEELTDVRTKTEVFKRAVNYVAKKTFFSDKMLSGETVDVFTIPGQNVFFQFGQLALESIKKSLRNFSEIDIFNHCNNDQKLLQAGFLIKIHNYPSFLQIDHYQILHKSFLEFFASYYLANMDVVCASLNTNLNAEIVSLMEKGYDRDKECLLLTFLGNFLQTRAHLLFKSLSTWGALYRADRVPLSNVLAELTITDEVVRSLSPLVPPKWEIDTWNLNPTFFNSESHRSLLRYGSIQKLIRILEWNPVYHCSLPETLHIDRLELRIADNFSITKFLKTRIQCTNFMCHFIRFDEAHWETIIDLFDSIQAEKVTLGVWAINNANIMIHIHKELTEGRWQTMQLHRLGLYGLNPHKDRKILSLAEDLITKNKIKEGVWVEIWKDSNLWNSFCGLFNARIRSEDAKSFFTKAANSCLQEMIFVSLSSQNMLLDLDQFFNSNKRPWKYLYTDGLIQFKLDKSKPQIGLPIKEIKLSWWKETSLHQAVNVLSSCHNIERIACRNELVRELVQVVSNDWPGFHSTTELNIKFLKENVHMEQLDCLLSFKNLQKLSLDLGSLGSTSLPASIAATLIVIIPSLSLKMMEILRVTEVNIPFVERILGGMLYSDQKKESLQVWEKYDPLGESTMGEMPWKNPNKERLEIDAIKVGFHSEITATELKYCLNFILQLLSKKQVKKFSLVDVSAELEDDIFTHVFVHRQYFRISREIEGFDITDTLRTHRKLNYLGLIRDRITLTYVDG